MLGVSPLSPALLAGLGLTRLEIGLLLPAVYVGGLFFALPGGRLADRTGVRTSFLGGLALAGLPLLVAALAPSFAVFLGGLVAAGIGWSLVNPALGRAIVEIFPADERGTAMGIKQMGLTVGGIIAALALPPLAAAWGWRAAVGVCAVVVTLPVLVAWRPLAALASPGAPAPSAGARSGRGGWWARRPALLGLFGSGFVLGMVQSAVLGYLPLFAVQAQAFGPEGAGALLAAAQAGGALSRVGLGAASDRWHRGRRAFWLVLTSAAGALAFGVCAAWPTSPPPVAGLVAFVAGVGALGWVGLYLIIAAEAGGPGEAGLLTGVAMAFIIMGLLVGAPLFGLLLEGADSYTAPWTVFMFLSLAAAAVLGAVRGGLHRESRAGS